MVFYSGHDSRNEYIYKFFSTAAWDLDDGTLYVARFDADGSGEWLPLTPQATTREGSLLHEAQGLAADDQGGILIRTCDAADLMGATPMDRPEWASVDPASGEVYMTLTNNSKRTEAGSEATYTNEGRHIDELGVGFATAPVNDANPRTYNGAGHIIRWLEGNDMSRFEWKVFVFGAAAADSGNRSGLTQANQFCQPRRPLVRRSW
ncbi:MAG: PhoX family protein [Halomonadaceae bacterium]